MTTETEDKTPAIVTVTNDDSDDQYENHARSLQQDLQSPFMVRMLKEMGRGMLYAGALFAAVMLASHIPGAHVIGGHALRAVHAVAEAAFGAFTAAGLVSFAASKVLEKKQSQEKVAVEETEIKKPDFSINDDVATKGGNTSLLRIQKGLSTDQRHMLAIAVSAVLALKVLGTVLGWIVSKIASIRASAETNAAPVGPAVSSESTLSVRPGG
ncbi:MAG TPA: hypothetical protein VGV92_08765 [Gammaproteobacteria bacterium]|nr:hypothetical protein [Gammaproteobacteria bacterium]